MAENRFADPVDINRFRSRTGNPITHATQKNGQTRKNALFRLINQICFKILHFPQLGDLGLFEARQLLFIIILSLRTTHKGVVI